MNTEQYEHWEKGYDFARKHMVEGVLREMFGIGLEELRGELASAKTLREQSVQAYSDGFRDAARWVPKPKPPLGIPKLELGREFQQGFNENKAAEKLVAANKPESLKESYRAGFKDGVGTLADKIDKSLNLLYDDAVKEHAKSMNDRWALRDYLQVIQGRADGVDFSKTTAAKIAKQLLEGNL